ncbi:MAG: YicC family protein [Calditrichaceae bacterium]|nr:YicC family protein [Calditrichaceae bacterium]MBN2709925.1 YicC family protein [Calditrichaceae bacterium]RQV92676.1 MAG: YicC family protein [Calditrichota bacterium]
MRSMTGFGKSTVNSSTIAINVEIRTVNNKFLDVFIRMPKELGALEKFARDLISAEIIRGKINLFVSLDYLPDAHNDRLFNENKLKHYYYTLIKMKELLQLESEISLDHLIGFKEIFETESIEENENEIKMLLQQGITEALTKLNEMRSLEGENLKKDIKNRASSVKEILSEIRNKSQNNVQKEFDRLYDNIRKLLDEGKIDRTRLEQELALIADKVDITEECVRMDSHLKLLNDTMERGNDVGKKITFILQEMLREANTMNSKTTDISIQHLVIQIKEEIEKLREQIQNIE